MEKQIGKRKEEHEALEKKLQEKEQLLVQTKETLESVLKEKEVAEKENKSMGVHCQELSEKVKELEVKILFELLKTSVHEFYIRNPEVIL